MDLAAIQQALRDEGLDGWLFVDFRGSDPIGNAILGLGQAFRSRRWFYFVPASGEPTRVVHAIESAALDALPGRKLVYLPWKQLHEHVHAALGKAKRVAMQYSPLNNIPYVAKVDAGTIELIRSFGVEPATSAGLVQRFEATVDDEQLAGHERAGHHLGRIAKEAFRVVAAAHKGGRNPPSAKFRTSFPRSSTRRAWKPTTPRSSASTPTAPIRISPRTPPPICPSAPAIGC